ncbi:MAG: hypothetical protein A2Y60_06320 [Chloroflexi bacterium RBG_13_54_9]|nr:MAG: hypothetical protein A2Y60_06320 [Chloroflexi bacterium RBG_13_54_9]
MWPWYRLWRPWGWGWPGSWRAIPHGWVGAPVSKEQETAMLEDEARWLERDIDSIRKDWKSLENRR